MKLIQQLEEWRQEHEKLSERSEGECTLTANYHQGMSEMANKVLKILPSSWTMYQLERVRIVGMNKQVDSLGTFFELDDAKSVLQNYRQKTESKGFNAVHAAEHGLFVDLYRQNGQGTDMEVSLTIFPLSIQ